jgi:hypothetical protein
MDYLGKRDFLGKAGRGSRRAESPCKARLSLPRRIFDTSFALPPIGFAGSHFIHVFS